MLNLTWEFSHCFTSCKTQKVEVFVANSRSKANSGEGEEGLSENQREGMTEKSLNFGVWRIHSLDRSKKKMRRSKKGHECREIVAIILGRKKAKSEMKGRTRSRTGVFRTCPRISGRLWIIKIWRRNRWTMQPLEQPPKFWVRDPSKIPQILIKN